MADACGGRNLGKGLVVGWVGVLAIGVGLTWLVNAAAHAAEPAAASSDTLADQQNGVAARYARLEELLLRLAEVESRENPERSALLRRVAKQSREKFVLEKLRGASSQLAKGQLAAAVTDQKDAASELQSLLTLLMSEDRGTRIRDEKKRIADLIKQLRISERGERSVRARTENGVDLDEVLKEQESLTKKADELAKQLDEPESPAVDADSNEKMDDAKTGEPKSSESKSDSGEPKDSDSSESKPSEDESKAGQPKASESVPSDDPMPAPETTPSESTPSESGSKSESKSEPSTPSESSEGSPPQQDSPPSPLSPPATPEQQAQQQVKKAIEKMREAEQKLAEKKREGASSQREAEEELRQAIDQLEKILRQLREEEIQRELARLEARLRKMAAMQSAVLDQTVRLAQTPPSQRNRTTDLKAGELSFEEQKITLEADRALMLLREEGSSVAFPEVVQQCREDTVQVTTRLGQSKIDGVTQGIQNDILAALEEMIAAVQQAQRDLEEKQQKQSEGQPSQQDSGDEPLVQAIAELKLLRTMQSRIQVTTDRYSHLLEEENSSTSEVLPLLRDLSERQNRLYEITRDLVTEQNQ